MTLSQVPSSGHHQVRVPGDHGYRVSSAAFFNTFLVQHICDKLTSYTSTISYQ